MKKIVFIILIMPFLLSTAWADELTDAAESIIEPDRLESALEQDALEISGELSLDGSYDSKGALNRLWSKLISKADESIHYEFGSFISLAAIALLCACADALSDGGKASDYISIIACCSAAELVIGGVDSIVSQTVSALNQMSDFSKAAMPAVFTAATACGAVLSSSAKYAAVCLAIDVIMSVSQKLIIPLVYAYIALSVSNSLFDNSILRGIARLIKWTATTAMTFLTIAFCGYITITDIITGAGDAVAVKTAKTVISTTLPVIGGIVSDAASVVLSAAGVIKNSAGAFSLIAVCAICVGPFAVLSVKLLFLRAAAAAADIAQGVRLGTMLNNVSEAMGLLLGLMGCSAIMMFISFMAAIKVVAV